MTNLDVGDILILISPHRGMTIAKEYEIENVDKQQKWFCVRDDNNIPAYFDESEFILYFTKKLIYPTRTTLNTWMDMFDETDYKEPRQGYVVYEKKCTCGCASIGSNMHSNWCDLKE